MSLLVSTLAATEGAAEHVSKTPFYVAGGLLAAWAVLVSLIGTVRPGFSAKAGVARLVMLLTAVLVAGVMSTAIITG
jgi:hypothetical protein